MPGRPFDTSGADCRTRLDRSGWTGYAPMTAMTFTAPHIDYAGLSPVIALTAGICAVLVGGVLSGRRQRLVVSALSLTTLAAAAGLCIWQWGTREDLVSGALRLDELGLAGGADRDLRGRVRDPADAGASRRPSAAGDEPRHGEFQALLLARCSAWTLLAQAQNLIAFFVALELLSVPLYVLCGSALRREPIARVRASST